MMMMVGVGKEGKGTANVRCEEQQQETGQAQFRHGCNFLFSK